MEEWVGALDIAGECAGPGFHRDRGRTGATTGDSARAESS